MTLHSFRTYPNQPTGIHAGKWDFSGIRQVSSAGISGWYIDICFPFFGGKRIIQLRYDKKG